MVGKVMAIREIQISQKLNPIKKTELVDTLIEKIQDAMEYDSPHLVTYLGYDYNENNDMFYIFVEYVQIHLSSLYFIENPTSPPCFTFFSFANNCFRRELGSLASILKQMGSFEETLIRRYAKQILKGLDYLHNLGTLKYLLIMFFFLTIRWNFWE